MTLSADITAEEKRAIRKKLTGKVSVEGLAEEMFTPDEQGEAAATTIAAGHLRAFVERIERLNEDKQAVLDDIRVVYAEAKAVGFDTRTIRAIVRLRTKDAAERQEEQAVLDLYMAALGMA